MTIPRRSGKSALARAWIEARKQEGYVELPLGDFIIGLFKAPENPMTPSYRETGILSGIVISSNAKANDLGRISIIMEHMARIRAQTSPGLNAIRIHIAPSEIPVTAALNRVFETARNFKIELIADAINTPFKAMTLDGFKKYMSTLAGRDIRVCCVDDCQRFTDQELEHMAQAAHMNGMQIIFSTGANDAVRIGNLSSLVHAVLELQMYRQGEDVEWPAEWIKKHSPGCWCFEMHKDDSGQMTTADDVKGMWDEALKLPILPKWQMLYGQDSKTNLLDAKFAKHWINYRAGNVLWWKGQLS